MTDISTAIAEILEAADYGTLGTDIFVDYFPSDPDDMVAVFSGVGNAPSHGMGGITQLRNPTIQVFVRGGSDGASHVAAKNKAEEIYRLLDKASVAATGVTFLHISPVDEPHVIEHDDNGRPTYSINFETAHEAPTGEALPPPDDGIVIIFDGGTP